MTNFEALVAMNTTASPSKVMKLWNFLYLNQPHFHVFEREEGGSIIITEFKDHLDMIRFFLEAEPVNGNLLFPNQNRETFSRFFSVLPLSQNGQECPGCFEAKLKLKDNSVYFLMFISQGALLKPMYSPSSGDPLCNLLSFNDDL